MSADKSSAAQIALDVCIIVGSVAGVAAAMHRPLIGPLPLLLLRFGAAAFGLFCVRYLFARRRRPRRWEKRVTAARAKWRGRVGDVTPEEWQSTVMDAVDRRES